jgi:hypothetical protein
MTGVKHGYVDISISKGILRELDEAMPNKFLPDGICKPPRSVRMMVDKKRPKFLVFRDDRGITNEHYSFTAWTKSMAKLQHTVYRAEKDEISDFHRDGRPIFFTDDEREALGYGSCLIEARLHTENMFSPERLVERKNGDWLIGSKSTADFFESEKFLHALYAMFARERVEAIYYHVEGGSWSEVERPEIQAWLRKWVRGVRLLGRRWHDLRSVRC